MTDNVTNELIFETLKAIQQQLSRMAEDISDMRSDALAHRSVSTGLLQGHDLHSGQIASIQNRLDRIERRLELADNS